MTTTSAPPQDLQAERYTLAGMFAGPRGVEAAAGILTAGDFLRPAHQVIFQAMVSMYAAGTQVTVVTLKDWITRDGDAKVFGGEARCGEYLLELYALPAFGVESHARLVLDRAVRRRVAEAATRMLQRVAGNGHDPISDFVAGCQDDIDRAAATASALDGDADEAMTAERFVASPRAQPVPVIPGLLNREDRVVVVGRPGSGKTYLAYQIAAACAAGVHPFAWTPMRPLRAMIIDLENPRYLVRSKMNKLLAVAKRHEGYDPDALRVFSHPAGLDLSKPGNAHLLASRIRQARPEVICAGPIYKMHADIGERADHTAVTDFWDRIRDRYGCALWLETHPPLVIGSARNVPMRPGGSGRWSNWPEFGLSLLPAGKGEPEGALLIDTFRGDREEGRTWPRKLHRNVMSAQGWPWVPVYPDGTLSDPLEEDHA